MTLKTTLLGAAALASLAGFAQADTVRMGIATEAYPPFATPDAAGNCTGWEIDIINAVCAAAAFECEIVATAWDGIIPSLTADKIDVRWQRSRAAILRPRTASGCIRGGSTDASPCLK